MAASALAYAGAFLFSVAATGLLVWRLLDDLIGEIRPLRAHDAGGGAPCWRCRRRLAPGEETCPRCRTKLTYVAARVGSIEQTYAVADQLNYGHFVKLVMETTHGQQISVMTPQGPVVRPGDDLEFVFDRRRRLRELNNRTLATGWRLPVRVIGRRSPFAVLGLMILVPVTTLMILLAPIYFFLEALRRSLAELSRLTSSNAHLIQEPDISTRVFLPIFFYLVALGVFGGLVLLARTRPKINREMFVR